MPRCQGLDEAIRQYNQGQLPSTLDSFKECFTHVLLHHADFSVPNPWTSGRNNSTRLRPRFTWRGKQIQLSGSSVTDSREMALQISAAEAWGVAQVREDCLASGEQVNAVHTGGEGYPPSDRATPRHAHATSRSTSQVPMSITGMSED